MDTKYIISKSLQDYDSNSDLIRYLQKHTRLETIEKKIDTERDVWIFYDRDTNDILFETEVEVLGIYHKKVGVWIWAWSVPNYSIIKINLSKELLLYALSLGFESSYLKTLLITSRGSIVDPIQLDIHIALASYIIKNPYIYPYEQIIDGYSMFRYYILLNTSALDAIHKKIRSKTNVNIGLDSE